MVEIAKALARKPRILILDEATSALTAADVAKVFAVLKRLRAEGLALLYISHRMHEIAELADDCTVFRNGRNVATYEAGTQDRQRGRRADDRPRIQPRLSAEAARCRDATGRRCWNAATCRWTDRLNDISLAVRRGRGRRARRARRAGPARAAAGAASACCAALTGEMLIDGKPVVDRAARRGQARRHRHGADPGGPQDRGADAADDGAREPLLRRARPRCRSGGIIDRGAEDRLIDEMVELLAIKTAGLDIPVGALSGGNQQKVVIAKWLMTQPRIILLNDPTRGIDVGTKQEIYQLLRRLADAGAAILFYSTDYDELIGCCDRVLVLYDGAVKRELVGRGDHRARADRQRAQHRATRDAGMTQGAHA